MPAVRWPAALLLALVVAGGAAVAQQGAEPNTRVPKGVVAYVPGPFPDRIVATPAQDAAHGFAVAWRTDAAVMQPWLEIVEASDSPDQGTPRRIRAVTRPLLAAHSLAHTHQARIDGLAPDTLYAWRVQGRDTWSPWFQLRTAPARARPLTLLYFGDTQNKNVSLNTRVVREAMRQAPEARLALFAGDLVSGGDGEDDAEWGEWFEALGALPTSMLVAPAAGNHEYHEQDAGTAQERRVLSPFWADSFALPADGAAGAQATTYWFDAGDLRVAVLDGTSALDLATAAAQAAWLERVLAASPRRWTVVMVHQPLHSPRDGRDNAALREAILPVLRRHRVDLVLQGHDHVYARRSDDGGRLPVFVVSVAGPKQYRLSAHARASMHPVGEDTQLFQVLRIDGDRLRYEARTATGRLYDAFELRDRRPGRPRGLVEQVAGRIPPRDCPRPLSPKGRADRCWE